MRHFRAFCAVTALPLGMGMAPTSAGLVALSSRSHAAGALLGCAVFAVAVAVIAVAAQQHWGATTGAQVASGGRFHRRNKRRRGLGSTEPGVS